jgi:ABC-2 type transport system permease protein
MQPYFQIVLFNARRFLVYPLEIFAIVLRRIIEFGFLALFWIIIAKSSEGRINILQIVSYFLIATSIDSIAFSSRLSFAKYLHFLIKDGSLNNFLIRPIKLIPNLFCSYLGEREGLNFPLGILTLILGIFISPIKNLEHLPIFFLFLVVTLLLSLFINVIIGLIAFYITEPSTLRFSFMHIIRVFSGLFIPLNLFPEHIKKFFLFTPFPGLIYGPTNSLISNDSSEHYQFLLSSIIWTIIIGFTSLYLWNKSIRKYDAIGI